MVNNLEEKLKFWFYFECKSNSLLNRFKTKREEGRKNRKWQMIRHYKYFVNIVMNLEVSGSMKSLKSYKLGKLQVKISDV